MPQKYNNTELPTEVT